jgi:DNA helicase II / ATP-dependent DNA helicase PcrA
MHYLEELNSVQRAAVMTIDGPVQIIAGPGSGKTRVLTYRIAHLIEQGNAPWEILALTFTNKAAKELKERISHVIGTRGAMVKAGTFHSQFAIILRIEAPKIGYPSAFTVYDTEDSTSIIRAVLKDMQLDPKVYNAAAVRSRISLMKNNLITPKLYDQDPSRLNDDKVARRPFFKEIYTRYVARCKRAGAMDFDDLLLRTFELFQANPEGVLEKYRAKFKHVLVDEFQDTNFLQYSIIRLLVRYQGSAENLAVVGDDAQSIYAFRGATIENILEFERDFATAKVFKLEQNYRSTTHIVSAANEVIAHNPKQLKKTIWTEKTDTKKIRVLRCQSDDEEARRVADLILEQKNRYHLPNKEIAILYRTNAQSRKFEDYLRRYNLNYRVYGGTSFYQRKEVKDFIAYLRLTINPNDEEALRRVINYPTRGIGDTSLDKISVFAEGEKISLWDALLQVPFPARTTNSILAFKKMVEAWQFKIQSHDAYKVAREVAAQSGLIGALKADNSPEGVARVENVQAVLDAIVEFVENGDQSGMIETDDRSLGAWLQTITLLTEADQDKSDPDNITLMSVHSAKGLEYQSVFVTGLEEELFPSFMALQDANGLPEERRLFYVAITRAKDHLTLSFADKRYRNGQLKESKPARFLKEIDPVHLELTGGSNFGAVGSYHASTTIPSTNPKASVSGAFQKARPALPVLDGEQLKNFAPSPESEILTGSVVLHQKFGKGKINSIDGPSNNRVASIVFDADTGNERKLVLRFAKLQIIA